MRTGFWGSGPRFLVFFGLLLFAVSAYPQTTFVYTNNDSPEQFFVPQPNSVSAFSVGANGELTPITGSPFATGGNARGQGSFFGPTIVTTSAGNFLYVVNGATQNISGFSIDTVTGALTPVPGSPFADPAAVFSNIALGVSPDGRFLYAASEEGLSITGYSIAPDGSLTQVGVSALTGPPGSVKVSPNGKFVAAPLLPDVSLNLVEVFDISPDGTLQRVAGSPFPIGTLPLGFLETYSVDFSCDSSLLFVTKLSDETSVGVLSVAQNGVLTPVAGSVFNFVGGSAANLVLSRDGNFLFVTSPASNTVASLSVAPGGSLLPVSGSPFADPAKGPLGISARPSGLALNQDGTFLYVANAFSSLNGGSVATSIAGFSVGSDGALTRVPGTPTFNGIPNPAFVSSLAIFPPKVCCAPPSIGNVALSPEEIWPPNHKMEEVTVSYEVSHDCPATCSLSVTSNNADSDSGPDWEILDANHVLLRAEKNDGGDRTYTIMITCTNSSGGSATSSVTITVRNP